MTGVNDFDASHEDDLIVVVVGLTATFRKRKLARRYFTETFGPRAYVPWIPYSLGLHASASWLSYVVRRRVRRGRHTRFHLVAYIGGGVLVRQLHARGVAWPIGRVVWDRGPPQEQVARKLVARIPAILLTPMGLRSIVDLSRIDISRLPFPPCSMGSGLILETRASKLARRLGIANGATSEFAKGTVEALLPGADAAIAIPLSHDEVYDDPRFLDQAAHFLRTGSFLTDEAEVLP
jgi:hypothetical protein